MVRRDVEAGGRRRKSRDALTSRPEIERLLDAARAPASPRELAGERAAVDLFARARLVDASTPRRNEPAARRSARTGLKAAIAAAGAVGVLSSGVAFAATGHVPFAATLKNVTHKVTGHAADDAGTTDATPTQGSSASPNGPKVAALQGLCLAYEKGKKSDHGEALQQRPFQVLVTAAGGQDQVSDFCASLPPRAHESGPGQTPPTHPTGPTNGPSAGPTDHPSHPTRPAHPTKPTQASSPTHKPTSHPTKQPPPTVPSRSLQPHPSQPVR